MGGGIGHGALTHPLGLPKGHIWTGAPFSQSHTQQAVEERDGQVRSHQAGVGELLLDITQGFLLQLQLKWGGNNSENIIPPNGITASKQTNIPGKTVRGPPSGEWSWHPEDI